MSTVFIFSAIVAAIGLIVAGSYAMHEATPIHGSAMEERDRIASADLVVPEAAEGTTLADRNPPTLAESAPGRISSLPGTGSEPNLLTFTEMGEAVSVPEAYQILNDEFDELVDNLRHSESGILKYGTYQSALSDLPQVLAGSVSLTELACGERLCAGAFSALSTDHLDAARSELFARMWESGTDHPKMYASVFHDVHGIAGTERRFLFWVTPIQGGAFHPADSGVVTVVPGPPTEADAGGSP